MVLLNTGLCLSPVEVASLRQGKSIVAAPRRFIAPGKRFLLLPSQELDISEKNKLYRPEAISLFDVDSNNGKTSNLAWAKCEFCQHITDSENVESIERLSVWNREALTTHLRNKGNLFLSFLRVFQLSENEISFSAETLCDSQFLNQIVSLPDYLNVSADNSVLTDEQFQDARDIILNLQVEKTKIILEKATKIESNGSKSSVEIAPPGEVTSQTDTPPTTLSDITWIEQIAALGERSKELDKGKSNYQAGTDFENVVRKSLRYLGFKIDYSHRGGAGGLDLSCSEPYLLIGECKSGKKIPNNTAVQLLNLGTLRLKTTSALSQATKLIIGPGKPTSQLKDAACKHGIAIINPHTLEKLVKLKKRFPGSINLIELRKYLVAGCADDSVSDYIEQIKNDFLLRSNIVKRVRKYLLAIRQPAENEIALYAAYIAYKLPEEESISVERFHEILLELSSPFAGHLGRNQTPEGSESFYFLRHLLIEKDETSESAH
ncbi:MAG: DUF1802 family protein [Leptolyngbyaceae cyanobacterium]